MKALVAALALALALAPPALAEGKSNAKRLQAQPSQGWDYSRPDRRPHSPNPQWDVYWNDGTYAGSDPDPHVRRQLYRDHHQFDD